MKLNVNDVDLSFTLDTAASVTIIGENTYRNHFSDIKCVQSDILLRSYSGQKIEILGKKTLNSCSKKSKCTIHVNRSRKFYPSTGYKTFHPIIISAQSPSENHLNNQER